MAYLLWESAVTSRAVQAAAAIIHHLNGQKFIMLGIQDDVTAEEDKYLSKKMIRLLSAEWRSRDGTVTPAEVSQKHICEKVGLSYPTSKALEIMRQAETLGYGEIN